VPFVGNTLIAIWEKVKSDKPRPIHELRRDAPLSLEPVVMRCLEKDPARRYQNVAELAKALLPLAPERSRGSVARIVRILEAPGVITASLSLPPSSHVPAETATSVSIQSAPRPASPRRVGVIAFATVVVLGLRELQRQGQNGASSRIDTPTSTPAQTAAPTQTQPIPVVAPVRDAVLPPADSASPTPSAPPTAAPPPVAPKPMTPKPAVAKTQHIAPAAKSDAKPASKDAPPATADASLGAVASFPSVASSASATVARSGSRPPAATASARPTSGASPWVVDIVEKRKAKPGETP
jgi:serine/threonine-protein kinase